MHMGVKVVVCLLQNARVSNEAASWQEWQVSRCMHTCTKLQLGCYAALQELPHGRHCLLGGLLAPRLGAHPLQAGAPAGLLAVSLRFRLCWRLRSWFFLSRHASFFGAQQLWNGVPSNLRSGALMRAETWYFFSILQIRLQSFPALTVKACRRSCTLIRWLYIIGPHSVL